jgi:hypothetical protein
MSIHFTVKTPKPRNPHAVAAHRRAAGLHGPTAGARRQRARQELRRSLGEFVAGP